VPGATVRLELVDVIERLRGAVPQEMDPIDQLRERRAARLLAMAAANGNGTHHHEED
jgi:hypothetical protein